MWRTANGSLQEKIKELENEVKENIDCLTKANETISGLEQQALESEEKAALTKARVDDLLGEIAYLRDQVKIYQIRLGLLPSERHIKENESTEPLRKPREPFAVAAARAQVQRTEDYWRKRAAEVKVDGVTGTTTDTPAVSEEKP